MDELTARPLPAALFATLITADLACIGHPGLALLALAPMSALVGVAL